MGETSTWISRTVTFKTLCIILWKVIRGIYRTQNAREIKKFESHFLIFLILNDTRIRENRVNWEILGNYKNHYNYIKVLQFVSFFTDDNPTQSE